MDKILQLNKICVSLLSSPSELWYLGQEDATIDYDEGIQITPFNMKDELEEGHFDSEGMYIFKKEKVN